MRASDRMPDTAVLPLGAALGSLGYLIVGRYRRLAADTLSRAYGETWSRAQIDRMAWRNCRHLGKTLAEILRMPSWDGDEIDRRVELRGISYLDAALARGRGVICVTAHYGNWELMAARVVRAGYPLTVIVRDSRDPGIRALIRRIRDHGGYRAISREGPQALRPALECLRRNELLGILLDRNKGSGGVYVDFFGHPAATATGPAVLARRTGASIIPVFDHRLPDNTHRVEFLPPVKVEAGGDSECADREVTAHLTRIIEARIRADPEQWFWIYDRWRR
jgi:KDO2-lipid IV(A) lauroyltransferase